ncbi:MAG: PAS domain-containing protein [Alphaproteobacteria bacterium]|nr:PAS domain-containing protein [Alphaproteobacteria bacterium]
MTDPLLPLRRKETDDRLEMEKVLASLPNPLLVIGPENEIRFANPPAEQFFEASETYLYGRPLNELLPPDSPLFTLIGQVREEESAIFEYGLNLSGPRLAPRLVEIQIAPVAEREAFLLLSIHERSIAEKIDRQLVHKKAARSVTAMAAMLAHEVKNPLSGIRGAAQLLESNATEDDKSLTRLICDETDRICRLVDRMEIFSNALPIERGPVNIHLVLNHVRNVAQTGFARHVRFVEHYDPSLPPVSGSRDQLIQVFLNLIKNSAEAVPATNGEIIITTAYQHGMRLGSPSGHNRVLLPLVVTVQDNGTGIADELRPHLFDAFVTSKVNGSGLGLALVAKIVNDHGGVIEFDSEPKRTAFRVMLPIDRERMEDA